MTGSRIFCQSSRKGESTAWYASFWRFCTAHLQEAVAQEALPVRDRSRDQIAPASSRGLEFLQDFEGLREFLRGSGHGRLLSGFVLLLVCVAD